MKSPCPPGTKTLDGQRTILVPVAYIRPFGNTIVFNFDFIPSTQKSAQNQAGVALDGQILCNSSLDLHGLALWTAMPNLELFANAGFPFTRMADLSETTVVLPSAPTPEEIALYLHLMAHFGQQTGYPVLRVTVDGPGATIDKGRDYLILGTIANQPAFSSLGPLLPLTVDSSGVHVKPANGYLARASSLQASASRWLSSRLGRPAAQNLPSNQASIPDAMVEEIASPASPSRSIVLVSLRQNSSADEFAGAFLDRSQSTDINGSVTLMRNAQFVSYSMGGPVYHVGDITWYAVMRIWLTRHYLLLLLVVTLLSLLAALWGYGWLSWHAQERLKLAQRGYTALE